MTWLLKTEYQELEGNMLIELSDLLGKPYVLHGRGPDGYDCYGLAIEVERRLGKELPDVCSQGSVIEGLVKTKEPKFGDIVMFKSRGRDRHIGVYFEKGDFVHCDFEGVRVSNLRQYVQKGEFYTWQQ